jgi:hypothetical protein
MLLGLIATAIPIWIHLQRRHDQTIAFPAISLLLRVNRRRASKLRLRRLLLMIVRILTIVLIVLASARPSVSVQRPGGIRTGASLALAIVLDDSLSMRLLDENNVTLFERASELAIAELGRLRPGDAATLILTTANPSSDQQMEFDLVQIQHLIKNAIPTYGRGKLEVALRTAFDVVRESPLTQKEVVLITDLSEGEALRDSPLLRSSPNVYLRIIDAGPDVSRDNVSVDEIRLRPSPEGVARELLVEAKISNHSDKKIKNLEIILEVGGAEAARGSLNIKAQSSAFKSFYHRFEDDGVHRGRVRIRADRLPEDDSRYFSVLIRRTITALVVDGDYRPGSYRDEAFYLQKALKTPMPGEVPIRVVVVDEETALQEPFSESDVVFLAGVADPSVSLSEKLVEYVENGGGLFVSPASAISQFESIDRILPGRVRSVRQAPRTEKPFLIASVNNAHPIFAPFEGGPTGLLATRVFQHLLVDPDPATQRVALISLSGGLPLLLERNVQNGKVILLTTTIDRDWTDLPIRPGFLPLIQRSARHLAGRLKNDEPKRTLVSTPVPIEVSPGMKRLVVRGPSNNDVAFSARELANRSSILFTDTHEPGFYQVWAEIPGVGGLRELSSLGFIVDTDAAESNLTRVLSPVSETNPQLLASVKGKLPIWPYLLVMALIFLLLETWLSGQGLKRSHIRQRLVFE